MTLYYKHLNLFLVVGIVVAGFLAGPYLYSALVPQASVDLPRSLAPTEGDLPIYDIEVSEQGRVRVNGEDLKGALTFEAEKTRLLLILVRKSDVGLDGIRATIRLPKVVTDPQSLNPRIYAIHGTGSSFARPLNGQTVLYEVQEVFPGATVSIELTFPSGYFDLTTVDQAREDLVSVSPERWIELGIIVPSIAGLFLFYLLLLRWFSFWSVRTDDYKTVPPSTIPPAVVGTLYHGQIGRREIAATLFDLARRGFVTIHRRGEHDVVFGKGQKLYGAEAASLRAFEVFLLHQIFGDEQGAVSKTRDIEAKINKELFSSQIALAYVNIYDTAIAEGYFIQSPNTYYLRYKMTGIIFFFLASAALLYGAFTLPEPAYILFLWAGAVAASLLIIASTPGLPRRTKTGTATIKQWMAFRHYLTDSMPIAAPSSAEFFTFLPYAIVLDCEKEWVSRWSQQTIALPGWFTAEQNLYTADDYEASIVSIISYLAHNLVVARPPDVA